MGRGKAKGKRKKHGSQSEKRQHANRNWSDCSPAFRAEAEALMLFEAATPNPKAGRLADKLASRYSESPLASHLAGHVHAEGKAADRALPHLHRASELEPNCLEISFSLASAHMAMQQFGQAANECKRALAIQDTTDPALQTVGLPGAPPLGPPDSSVSAAVRVVFAKERLRGLLAQVSTLPTTAEEVRQFCRGMTELQLQSFVQVQMTDLTAFFLESSNSHEQHLATSLEAALEFRRATNTWQYWVCPQCNCQFPNANIFLSHMEEKHVKSLPKSFLCVPKRISDKQLEFLMSWDPVPGADESPKEDSGCKGHAAILNQIKSQLMQLTGLNVLSVDLMDKLTEQHNKGGNCTFLEQLNAIEALDTQCLQNLARRLQLTSPTDWYREKKCDVDNDSTVHFRTEEETIVLDFGDGNTNGSVNRDLLFSWLCKPVHERSWTSTRQDCITNGAEVLGKLEEMVTSLEQLLKRKCSLTENDYDYFDKMASIDVDILRRTDELEYLKKRLIEVCSFDYSVIILPAFKAYLNAKVSPLLKDVQKASVKGCDKSSKSLDDSRVSQDQSHEQLQEDTNVSQPHQEAQSHDETERNPNPTTKSTYADAHLILVKAAKTNFLRLLKEFKLNPEENPFYAGELRAMVHRGSSTFCVYYKHTKQYDDLSKSLCQHYQRIKDALQEAIKEFIIEENMVAECKKVSNTVPKLYICDLPPPDSIQALAVFKEDKTNVLVEVVKIYGNPNDIVLDLTELGRNLYLGFLRFVIGQHKRGKSWAGILTIEDLQVRYGSVFEISKEALVDTTSESMAKDFKKLAELLMPSFRKSGLHPVYFAHLENDLSRSFGKIGTCGSDLKTIRFHRYFLSHLALKSAMARGHLWLDIYRVHQLLGRVDQESLKRNLIKVPLSLNWTVDVENHPLLKTVLDEGLDPKGRNSQENYYENHLQHLLLFIRHVVQHGPDHTKGGKGDQELKNLMETDLIIAKYLSEAVMQLVCRCVDLLQQLKLIDADLSHKTTGEGGPLVELFSSEGASLNRPTKAFAHVSSFGCNFN